MLAAVVTYIRHPEVATQRRYGVTQRHGARRSGTRTLPWLDDLAFFLRGHLSFAEACTRRDEIHELLRLLGLMVAPGKGQFDPTHFLEEHLGYGIDSERGLFLLTARREQALAGGAHGLFQQRAPSRSKCY